MTVFSCYGCDKHSGDCHAKCETNKREKAEHDARMAEHRKRTDLSIGLNTERGKKVRKARGREKHNESVVCQNDKL